MKQAVLALRDVIAFVIFAVASITDFFDGMLARKNNWITSFGKFADPIADKMLVNTVLILMVYFHQANVIAVLLDDRKRLDRRWVKNECCKFW